MSIAPLLLASGNLDVIIDPRRGADIMQVTHRPTRTPLLFRTPWWRRAESVRSGSATTSVDSLGRFLEGDAGGWQVLCPNAGPERTVAGGVVGFHGEAAIVPWAVHRHDATSAELSVDLFSVPLRITRVVQLDRSILRVRDEIVNESPDTVAFDYSQHPTLGGPFLQQPSRLETNAATFTADWEAPGADLAPGSVHPWPRAVTASGSALDLTAVPGAEEPRALFGWLSGFPDHAFAELTSAAVGLTVRITWDGTQLPYAWLWQELEGSAGYPWFRRARALAVEPATCVTSGPDRAPGLILAGYEHRTFETALSVTPTPSVSDQRGSTT